VTVLEIIQRSTEYLARQGVESARRNIEEMLAQVLGLPRLQLYLNFERVLTDAQLDVLRSMVRRRGRREPLQHILGTVSFCGLELSAGPQALVPRPETELLAERAWRFLQSVRDPVPAALDVGTGTGCLAIALAVNVPTARLVAVDISADALALARRNAETHQVADRIQWGQGDGFGAVTPGWQFDLVVSNPPYIATAEIATLQPEVRDFDPRAALDGGPDGLEFFRRLALETGAWLKPCGRLMCEFGDGQAEALRGIFSAQNWIVEAVEEDYSRRPRVLVARRS
jgi:release factor glutamine methyltransferase